MIRILEYKDEESWVQVLKSKYIREICITKSNVFTFKTRGNLDFQMSSSGVLSTISSKRTFWVIISKFEDKEMFLNIWPLIILLGVVLMTNMGTSSDNSKSS